MSYIKKSYLSKKSIKSLTPALLTKTGKKSEKSYTYLRLQLLIVGLGHRWIQRISVDRPRATDPRRDDELSLGIEVAQLVRVAPVQRGVHVLRREPAVILLDHGVEQWREHAVSVLVRGVHTDVRVQVLQARLYHVHQRGFGVRQTRFEHVEHVSGQVFFQQRAALHLAVIFVRLVEGFHPIVEGVHEAWMDLPLARAQTLVAHLG